jgi:hypothetical protein
VIGAGMAHDHPLLRIVAKLEQLSAGGEERRRRRADQFGAVMQTSTKSAAAYRFDDNDETLLGRLR